MNDNHLANIQNKKVIVYSQTYSNGLKRYAKEYKFDKSKEIIKLHVYSDGSDSFTNSNNSDVEEWEDWKFI